jgi:hypothetical protein
MRHSDELLSAGVTGIGFGAGLATRFRGRGAGVTGLFFIMYAGLIRSSL